MGLFSNAIDPVGSQAWRDALNRAINSEACLFNFNGNTPYLLAALANARAAVANAKLGFLGDSTTRGTGAGTTTAQVPNSYPFKLAARLTELGLVGKGNNVIGTGNLTWSTSDSRTVLSGGATQAAVNLTIGGAMAQLTATGNTFSFTPVANCDTFDVYSIKTGATGAFTINLDGGATLATVSGTITPAQIIKTTVSGTLAGHTLNCVWSSGTCYVVGVHAYDSTVKCVECMNFGASGALTSNLVDLTAGYSWGDPTSLAVFGVDCWFLNIGINDMNTGASLTTALNNVQTLINKYRGLTKVADCILVNPWPISLTVSQNQSSYADGLRALALANNIPLIDMYAYFGGDYVRANALGLTFDTLHPNGPGYNMYAAAHMAALRMIA